MKKTSYILTLLAAASALLLSGCAKEAGNGADAVLSFSADTPEIVEVKAAAVTSVSDFYTKGYAGTTQWFPDPSTSTDPVNVVIPGTATFGDYKWKTNETKTFFAYSNNLPTSGATASITNSGVTLTYTAIPADATNQTDVTLGRYSGNGDKKGEAKMTFYHPLAQVVFKMGDMVGVSKIDKIEIQGVYNAGATTLSTSTATSGTPAVANFSWTSTSGSAKVSQTVNSLPSKGSEFGVPFMLIPQNLATQNVTVSVTVTTTGSSSVTLTKKLTSGTFATGKKTVCTLTVNPDRELVCNLAAYTANNDDDIFVKSTHILYTTVSSSPIYISEDSPFKDKEGRTLTYINDFDAEGKKGIITIYGELYEVNDNAFACLDWTYDSIKTIEFPEGVVKFGNRVFFYHYNLEEVKLPLSAIDIYWGGNYGKGSFYIVGGSHHLQKIVVGDTDLFIQTNNSDTTVDWPGVGTVTLHTCCFAKGTLITMADGSKKPVEELEYGDVLKVWNFDEGHEDSADILWITKRGIKMPYYFKCTFSDGTVLNVIGEDGGGTHRIFDKTKGSFEHPHTIPVDDEIYTDNGLVKLVSYERIDEEVEYFNLITTKHINCYANDVLTSARYNNRWPIDQDMKFVKDGRKIRSYREFKKAGISREWYVGMRLGEQQDSIPRVKAYIDRCEMFTRPKPEQPVFTRLWEKIVIWWKSIFG